MHKSLYMSMLDLNKDLLRTLDRQHRVCMFGTSRFRLVELPRLEAPPDIVCTWAAFSWPYSDSSLETKSYESH